MASIPPDRFKWTRQRVDRSFYLGWGRQRLMEIGGKWKIGESPSFETLRTHDVKFRKVCELSVRTCEASEVRVK